MAALDELLVGLGFEYDPEDAKKFNADYQRTLKLIKGLAKAAIGAAAALTGMAIASSLASEEQGNLADEIGETVENLDALQFAMRRSGGTADGMSNSLRQLAKISAEAARGVGSGVEAFGILGISVTKADGSLRTTSDLLLEVSERFKTLSRAQQIDLADKLGISDSVRLLQQGPDAIRALTDEARALGVTTAEDAKIANEFQDSLDDLWQVVKQLSRTLTKVLAPVLKNLVSTFTEWWKVNRQMIEQNLPKFINGMVIALKLLAVAAFLFLSVNLATTLVSLAKLFIGLKFAALGANAAILLIPALAIAAGVAVALLAEDLFQFFTGGKSAIADFLEEFPKINRAFEIMGNVFRTIFNNIGSLIDDTVQLWDDFISGIKKSADFIKDVFAPITDLFQDPEVKKTISNTIETIGDNGKPILDDSPVSSTLKSIRVLGALPSRELSVNGTAKSQSTSIEKIEISVSSNSDSPREVAKEVMRAFQQTSTDLNSVVVQ